MVTVVYSLKLKNSFYVYYMWQSESQKHDYWLGTAAYTGTHTVDDNPIWLEKLYE